MSRIRVAIIGTSFGRLVQAPGFQRHPGFELVAISGRDPARTAEVARELGIPAAHADWREMLEQEKPELVSIATPAWLHHPMMLAAIAAGAHVLCEKPTALHRWQATEMRDRAAQRRRVAAINHEFRSVAPWRFALERVRRHGVDVDTWTPADTLWRPAA